MLREILHRRLRIVPNSNLPTRYASTFYERSSGDTARATVRVALFASVSSGKFWPAKVSRTILAVR